MNILERLKAKTPKKNKKITQVTAVIGAVSLAIAESGMVDHKPLIKIGLEVLSVKLGVVSVYNAQKVAE